MIYRMSPQEKIHADSTFVQIGDSQVRLSWISRVQFFETLSGEYVVVHRKDGVTYEATRTEGLEIQRQMYEAGMIKGEV